MDRAKLSELVESSDLNGLVRFVDGLPGARDWDGLFEVRDRCREALERGKQLAGVAEYAEYRSALDAPPSYAARAVVESAALWTLGPLWEVAASTHTWADLDPHLPPIPARAFAAHERVVRGEDLREADIDPAVVDLPPALEGWEPAYPVATYRPDKADFPAPDPVPLDKVDLPAPAPLVEDPAVGEAFLALVRAWVDQSNGRCEVVMVDGPAGAAVAALGHSHVLIGEVPLPHALAWMVWAGANGGAHGRRRGTPVGRLNAWWTLMQLTDHDTHDGLGEAAGGLRWFAWEPLAGSAGGWSLRLAIESPEGSWAVEATDALED